MKKLIINIAKKNQTIRTLIRKMMNFRKNRIYKYYCKRNKVQDNIILFESYMGRSYACSPRAIYEQMLTQKRFKDFEFVWFFRNPENKKNIDSLKRATLVEYESRQYYEYYSKAKYFVSNSRIPEVIKKREGQVYIQCWHGTPLKRLGYDLKIDGSNAMNSLKDTYKKYKEDAERYTYLLSPSTFCTEKLTSCFNLKENNPEAILVQEGYPRNDFLYNYTKEDIVRVKENLGITDNHKKILLYAPTWRDNQHEAGVGYTYQLGIDFYKMQQELQEEYIILFRPHYFVANQFDFEKYKGFIYNAVNIDDINDLYIISDMIITDYSSVFFDYANLKRPILFYMYDLEDYQEHIRGFYIGLEELPGEIVTTEEELIKEIKKYSQKFEYDEKYKNFNEKYNALDDGKAAERVVERCIK